MSTIALEKDVKEHLVRQLQDYFEQELDQEIGEFQAEFLLDFFAEKAGGHFYNQGLLDAQAALSGQMDNLLESIDLLQKPTGF